MSQMPFLPSAASRLALPKHFMSGCPQSAVQSQSLVQRPASPAPSVLETGRQKPSSFALPVGLQPSGAPTVQPSPQAPIVWENGTQSPRQGSTAFGAGSHFAPVVRPAGAVARHSPAVAIAEEKSHDVPGRHSPCAPWHCGRHAARPCAPRELQAISARLWHFASVIGGVPPRHAS